LPQPFKTRAIALASNGKHIYVVGGMSEEGITSAVHLYDTKEGKWSKGPNLPGFAFGTSAYAHNGRVYATNWEGTLYSHAAGEETWRAEATLTFPRFFHRLVAVNGEFAVIGGTSRGGQIRNIEWVTPGAKGPRVTRVTIPAPGNAKCRQGIFFYNNELYVFGGNNSVEDHQFKPENFLDEAYRINLHALRAERIATAPVKRQSYQTFLTGADDRFAETIQAEAAGLADPVRRRRIRRPRVPVRRHGLRPCARQQEGIQGIGHRLDVEPEGGRRDRQDQLRRAGKQTAHAAPRVWRGGAGRQVLHRRRHD
jgi:hypothetical protein